MEDMFREKCLRRWQIDVWNMVLKLKYSGVHDGNLFAKLGDDDFTSLLARARSAQRKDR